MMKALTRQQVIGSRIERVRHAIWVKDGWLDAGQAYITLQAGVSFVLPGSHSEAIESVEPPRNAKDLARKDRERLVGKTVAELYRLRIDGEEAPESCVLALDDGTFVTETTMAPRGTGAVGLLIYSAREWAAELAEEAESVILVPFFS